MCCLKYGTAQNVTSHTHVYWLVHKGCANVCPVTSDGTLTSLTYYTCILHERAAHMHVVLEWVHTRMKLVCRLHVVDRALER